MGGDEEVLPGEEVELAGLDAVAVGIEDGDSGADKEVTGIDGKAGTMPGGEGGAHRPAMKAEGIGDSTEIHFAVRREIHPDEVLVRCNECGHGVERDGGRWSAGLEEPCLHGILRRHVRVVAYVALDLDNALGGGRHIGRPAVEIGHNTLPRKGDARAIGRGAAGADPENPPRRVQ